MRITMASAEYRIVLIVLSVELSEGSNQSNSALFKMQEEFPAVLFA